MSKFKVVVTDEIGLNYEIEQQILNEIDAKVIFKHCMMEDELIDFCQDADGILCNLAPMTSKVINSLNKCRIISRYGIGFDNIDMDTCNKKNIYVANVPDYCFEEVAEHTIALMMACSRKISLKDKNVKNGIWDSARKDKILRISGKTLAFLGFGHIPKTVLKKIKSFGFSRILVFDPFVDKEIISNEGAEKVEFDEAIKTADYISVHLPLNNNTRNLINKDAFNNMKKNAIIINTSRGGIIEENDLVNALIEEKILAAGLDVYSSEPVSNDSPLLQLDNCVLTDHVAFYSEESIIELKTKCAENVRDALNGLKPRYLLNKF